MILRDYVSNSVNSFAAQVNDTKEDVQEVVSWVLEAGASSLYVSWIKTNPQLEDTTSTVMISFTQDNNYLVLTQGMYLVEDYETELLSVYSEQEFNEKFTLVE